MAGALGAASMFGNPQTANAQNVQQQRNDTTQISNQQNFTVQQLQKMFPQAYADKDANPEVWQKNQVSYVGQLPNGKQSLVGKIAASHGQNPWDALVKRYCPQNDNVFQLGDFDI